jgi:hypothetical protein
MALMCLWATGHRACSLDGSVFTAVARAPQNPRASLYLVRSVSKLFFRISEACHLYLLKSLCSPLENGTPTLSSSSFSLALSSVHLIDVLVTNVSLATM